MGVGVGGGVSEAEKTRDDEASRNNIPRIH